MTLVTVTGDSQDRVMAMDVPAVVGAVVSVLTPFLPLLTRIGEGAVDHAIDEVGNRIDAKAWELAKALWTRLRSRVDRDPALKQATDELAVVPADPARQQALQDHLQQALSTDPQLLTELEQLLTSTDATRQTYIADELNIGVQAESISGGKVNGVGKQVGLSPQDDR